MNIPPDIAAKYPPTIQYCERCKREHAFYPRGFWQEMARRKMREHIAEDLDRRTFQILSGLSK